MSRKRKSKDESLEPVAEERDDPTLSDMDASAMLASSDQFEAEKRGEANPPPTKVPDSPPEAPKESLSLRAFVAIDSRKWDQMAGFNAYAKLHKLGPRSTVEWRAAFTAFMNRPV